MTRKRHLLIKASQTRSVQTLRFGVIPLGCINARPGSLLQLRGEKISVSTPASTKRTEERRDIEEVELAVIVKIGDIVLSVEGG